MSLKINLSQQVQQWCTQNPALCTLFRVFTQAGHEPRFVGGCVRDGIFGKKNTEMDFDIAVPCPPETTQKILTDNGIKCVPIGLDYGCVMAVMGEQSYEITSLRADVATDGRRATVAYTTDWQTDSHRRDLTINAISCDINGTVYDYHNGVSDLQNGTVQFVGNADLRVREDILRILRYYRFFQTYANGTPTPNVQTAFTACQSHADKIPTLSGERIWAELGKILAHDDIPKHTKTIALMADHGILNAIMPTPDFGAEYYTRLCQNLDTIPLTKTEKILARLCGIYRGGGADSLRLSTAESKILAVLATPLITPNTEQLYHSLHTHGMPQTYARLVLSGQQNADQIMANIPQDYAPQFPLTGQDIMTLGIPHGKQIGTALTHAKSQWYKSKCTKTPQHLVQGIREKFGL